MGRKIVIKIPKRNSNSYLQMNVPWAMKVPGLLKMIEAKELTEFSAHIERMNMNKKYRNFGSLEDGTLYDVHTVDPNKTVDLIQNYNHQGKETKLIF